MNEILDLESSSQIDKGKSHSSDSALIDRMRIQVKQNLVFKIRNLHIRHERKSSDQLGHPFSFGITLHYLELSVSFHREKFNSHDSHF